MGKLLVPLNDLSRSAMTREELNLVAKVLQSGNYILGENVKRFEAKLADKLGAAYSLAVANGTDALQIGLRSLGVQRGDFVAVTPNAGGYATTALELIGAIPLFVDCNDSGQMDLDSLQDVVNQFPSLRFVVVTHLYGYMGTSPQLIEWSKQRGLLVLEDCAQSLGASADQMAGTLGHIATFSFYPTKPLGALGDAGAISTSDEALHNRALALRQYGWTSRYSVEQRFGTNSRMDELQATILNFRLEELDARNAFRRKVWSTYSSVVSGSNWRLIGDNSETFVAHLAILVCPSSAIREQTIAHFREHGIETSIHYPILDYKQIAWQHLNEGICPNAESLSERILTIPLFDGMHTEEQALVCEALSKLEHLS